MYAKLKPISTSKTTSRKSKSPHPSQQTTELLVSERARLARSRAIAEETRASIDEFEASIRGSVAVGGTRNDGVTPGGTPGVDGEGDSEKRTARMVSYVLYGGLSNCWLSTEIWWYCGLNNGSSDKQITKLILCDFKPGNCEKNLY